MPQFGIVVYSSTNRNPTDGDGIFRAEGRDRSISWYGAAGGLPRGHDLSQRNPLIELQGHSSVRIDDTTSNAPVCDPLHCQAEACRRR